LNEDILSALLQAEGDYYAALKNAAQKSGEYAAKCKREQSDFIDSLARGWDAFEKAENDKLKDTLAADERRMEEETKNLKERLRDRQRERADTISERLKEEVLALYGSS